MDGSTTIPPFDFQRWRRQFAVAQLQDLVRDWQNPQPGPDEVLATMRAAPVAPLLREPFGVGMGAFLEVDLRPRRPARATRTSQATRTAATRCEEHGSNRLKYLFDTQKVYATKSTSTETMCDGPDEPRHYDVMVVDAEGTHYESIVCCDCCSDEGEGRYVIRQVCRISYLA